MPAYYNQVIANWSDGAGKQATSFMTTQNQASSGTTPYTGLATALQNCAAAHLDAIQFQTTIIFGGTPLPGPYSTAVDRAVMLGNILSTGAPYRLSVVGPLSTIFQAGNSLVDLSNANIVALESASMSVLGDSLGNPIGPFKRGIRQMARGN